MVAHAKGQTAAFLREMRALDRRVGVFEQNERLGVERLCLIAPAGVPQKSPELAHDTGCGGMIACILIAAQRHVVMFLRGFASADRAAQIGDALAERKLFELLLVGRPQGGQRLLVVTDGVVIGVSRTGPIAGDTQEACALRLLLAQAEMVTERDQVLEPLDPGRRAGFERAPDAAVQFHASLQQQVLIDDVLEQRLGEAVLRLEPRTWLLVDELGIEQEFEVAAHPRRVTRDRAQERGIEAQADHGGLLDERARRARQPIDPGEQNALDVERNFGRPVIRERSPV